MSAQLVFNLPHRTAFGRENFFVSPSNLAAVELVDGWENWQPPVLLLLGAAGSGKTHLAKVWQAHSGAHSFFENPQAPMLLVEDIDKQPLDEEAFFTTLNSTLHSKTFERAMLLTTTTLDWTRFALPDLRSRLTALPMVELAPPDDALLGAVLVKLFTDRQLQVSQNLVSWLLLRMERSFAAALALVEQLDKESARRGKPINQSLARELLG